MTEQDRCTKCGAPLLASVRGGLCPACLLNRGLETNTVGFTGKDQAVPTEKSIWDRSMWNRFPIPK